MEIVLAILGISFLVVVHETGHYLAARAFGMRVLRYSIGFGPPLFRYQPKDSPTIFQVCAIPFLAYVQIDGMNPAEETDPDDPGLFPNKGIFARMVTIFAGSFANYLAATVIMFGFYVGYGMPHVDDVGPMVVGDVAPESRAEAAGVRTGDRIVEANGRPIANIAELIEATRERAEQPTTYVIERDGQRLDPLTITPERSEDGRGIIGVTGPLVFEPMPVGEAALTSVLWPVERSIGILGGMYSMIERRSTEGLRGPIGMGKMAAAQAERGARNYIPFIAFISVALGLFNLLPFPALDGGRLVFLGFELITRRRANERIEAIVHTVGILFLLGVIVLVTFRDVTS
jgi:regulator of sigma E protease